MPARRCARARQARRTTRAGTIDTSRMPSRCRFSATGQHSTAAPRRRARRRPNFEREVDTVARARTSRHPAIRARLDLGRASARAPGPCRRSRSARVFTMPGQQTRRSTARASLGAAAARRTARRRTRVSARNVFSRMRSCAIATLSARGATRALRARNSSAAAGTFSNSVVAARAARGKLAQRRRRRDSRRRCAGPRRCPRGCRGRGRARRRDSPGSARPCRTCGRAARRRAARATSRRRDIATRGSSASGGGPAVLRGGGTRIARAVSVCATRNAASLRAHAASLACEHRDREEAALAAPASPIANVATGNALAASARSTAANPAPRR